MPPRVDKKQKGFQLPEDVIAWLEKTESQTGATLSRLALAAFCAYMLCSEDTQREAIQFAMAVERGDVQFSNLREEWVDSTAASTRFVEKITSTKGPKKEQLELRKSLIEHRQLISRRGIYKPNFDELRSGNIDW